MATSPDSSDWRPGFREYAGCYALYLVIVALSVATMYGWLLAIQWLFPIILGWDLMMANAFAVGLTLLLVGIALFSLVLLAEPYLRAGIQRREIRRRFARVAIPLVAVGVLGYATRLALVLFNVGGRL